MADDNSYQIINKNRTMKLFFLGIFALVILFLIFIFRFYAWIFLFSIIFYIALRPLFDKLQAKIRSRAACSTIVTLLLFFLVLTPSLLLLFSLYDQSSKLYRNINNNQAEIKLSIESVFSGEFGGPVFQENFNDVMQSLNIDSKTIPDKIVSFVTKRLDQLSGNIKTAISLPIMMIVKFLLMILILFFLFKDGHKADGAIYKILPLPDDIEMKIIARLKEVVSILVFGNLIIMILQGFVLGLGLVFCGIESPLLWGTIASIFSLIPVIGTSVVWIPASIYLLVGGHYGWAAFIAIWSFSWFLFFENVVKPKVFGNKLNFHPIIFFFLLLGSIQEFGLSGIIVGPLLLSLFYSLWEIYKLLDAYDLDNKRKSELKKIKPPQ